MIDPLDYAGTIFKWPNLPANSYCPMCSAILVWRNNGLWCDRCHAKCESCCEGRPQ